MILFFLVMTAVWALAHAYVARRLMSSAGPWRTWRAVVPGVLGAHFLFTTGVFAARDLDPGHAWVSAIKTAGYLGVGGFSSLVAVFAVVDLVLVGGAAASRWRARRRPAHGAPDPERRAFLTRGAHLGVLAGSVAFTGVGHANTWRPPELVRVDVPLPGLHPDLEGLRIVQISDVHLGPTVSPEFLVALVERTNALEPDLVAITGDLVEGWVRHIGEWVAPLAELRAPMGTFFVTGNHEYYWDGPAWCDRVAAEGVVVLNNRHVLRERGEAVLAVGGCTDYTAGQLEPSHRTDPEAALAGAPEGALRLMLAHQPLSIHAAARAGADLQLSGHTHGGQYFPWNLVVGAFHPYTTGLHRHGETTIYVSRGTAWWGPPMRLGAPAELTLLTLSRAG